MAEQLLDQVRDIAEGQIVCQPTPRNDTCWNVKLTGLCLWCRTLRDRSWLSCSLPSSSVSLAYVKIPPRKEKASSGDPFTNSLAVSLGPFLHRWILSARYQARRVYSPGGYRPDLRARRTTVAFLQPEPSQVASNRRRIICISPSDSGYRRESISVIDAGE